MSLQAKTAYRGRIIESGLEEKTSGSVQWAAKFELTEQKIDGEWQPIDPQFYTSYQTLINKNGQPNTITCDMLKKVFSWPYGDMDFLERDDWVDDGKAQVWADFKLDENKQPTTQIEIKYINHFDYEGGGAALKKLGQQGIQSLASKYGAAFRAAGGATATATRPATKPTTIKKSAPSSGVQGKDLAWAKLHAKIERYALENAEDCKARYGASAKADKFRELAADFATEKQKPAAKLTTEEFNEFAEQIERSFDAATGSMIPF